MSVFSRSERFSTLRTAPLGDALRGEVDGLVLFVLDVVAGLGLVAELVGLDLAGAQAEQSINRAMAMGKNFLRASF